MSSMTPTAAAPSSALDATAAPPATTAALENARQRLAAAHGQRIAFELAPTSVAVARTGAFALVGCTDGSIRLCAVGARSKLPPANLGQLVCSGMNNKLLVTVAISEDCRTAFSGAQKGATVVLAWTFGSFAKSATPQQIVATTIQESQSEAKLRGFVSCSRAGEDDYRLLCGRGIKSAHVWKVRRPTPGAALDWSLLYELPTQSCGSLVCGGFLAQASAVWAKAEQGSIRLWNIAGPDVEHEDLRHARTALGVVAVASCDGGASSIVCGSAHVAVGGATLIEVSAPSGAVRAPLAPPPKPGAGRRCAPRTVSSVACASQGSAAIAFADGAVAWYDADTHRLLEVDATSGAPAQVACVSLPLGGALVGACHWDVKNREGWVSLFVPEKSAPRIATAGELAVSKLWPVPLEAPVQPKRKAVSSKVTPRGAKQHSKVTPLGALPPSPSDVPVVTTQRKRPRNPQTPVSAVEGVDFSSSDEEEEEEHPLNAAAPRRVPYEALPAPGHTLRLIAASARRGAVPAPTWHWASPDARERETLERLRALPPGNEDIVDATLGRLRLERQVAEALAGIGMGPEMGQP